MHSKDVLIYCTVFRTVFVMTPSSDITCFLCCENGSDLRKSCLCDVHAHAACLRKLVNVPSHTTRCAVCRHPYRIAVRPVCRLAWRWNTIHAGYVALAYAGTLAMWLGIALLVYHGTVSTLALSIQFGIMSFATCMGTACFAVIAHAHALYRRATGQLCCVGLVFTERQVMPLREYSVGQVV